ncbi:MAG: chromosome partitioning protein ParA [Candidatus Doudnabacteria bacterium]|nr:chromosome partitioning protein ParA [Candidatus Doudnabacteria bacterium]
MNRLILSAILLSFLSLTMSAKAQSVVSLNDSVDQHLFNFKEIEWLEDADSKLTMDEVLRAPWDKKFQPSRRFNPTNEHRQSTYWFRIKVAYPAATRRNWVIEFFDQTIDQLEFYAPDANAIYKSTLVGDEMAFGKREIWHKNFIVNITPVPNQEITYYIKLTSRQKADVLIVLRAQSWLFQYALDEYFFFGIFYGMILVFSFYNLLMFLAVRERHYLFYILYLLSLGLYEMSADGIGFQYLWPDFPQWNYYSSGIFLYLSTSFALIFSASLLNLRNENQFLLRLFLFAFILRTGFLLISVTVFPEWFRFRFVEIIPFLAIYGASIHSYFVKKYSPARFLVMAYSFVAFGILYKVLQYLEIEWRPLGELSHYSLGLSFIIEMLLLSFAITDKIRLLRLEKEQAQARTIEQLHENQELKENQNQLLTEQVKIKTHELLEQNLFIEEQNRQLEAANHQLEQQAQEIAEINLLLSTDNQKLQHDVAEVKEARILSKEVDFDEFSKMYPDDQSCLRFIADKKWVRDFQCIKCNYAGYSEGKTLYSRRCSRCGYDESVTAFTLLQNTRLPINKAFYMIFLVYSSNGTISSHKLSEILGIRQSTCWAYSAKIKKAMREYARIHKNAHQHGWDSILMVQENA